MVMADWDVDGYMKLKFGRNPKGATYYIDNFTITTESLAGMRVNSDYLLVDNFNQKKETNAFNGQSFLFEDENVGKLDLNYTPDTYQGDGHALLLDYDLFNSKSYAGYVSPLPIFDLREFQLLRFLVKVAGDGQDCHIGLRDSGCLIIYLIETLNSGNWLKFPWPLLQR